MVERTILARGIRDPRVIAAMHSGTHKRLPQFTQLVGGAYCFLPGISAVRFIAGVSRDRTVRLRAPRPSSAPTGSR